MICISFRSKEIGTSFISELIMIRCNRVLGRTADRRDNSLLMISTLKPKAQRARQRSLSFFSLIWLWICQWAKVLPRANPGSLLARGEWQRV